MMPRPLVGLSVLLALLAACDIPSAAPKWDMTWNVPGQSTSISVNSILPSGVTANGANTAFQVTVQPVAIQQTLAQDCGACVVANGTTVPKPAFVATGNGSATLPNSVTSATLIGDTLVLTVTNGFNFDPLQPTAAPAGDTGWVVTTVKSGAVVIGKDSANGLTFALGKNGAVATRKIALSGSVAAASGVSVSVTIDSPKGDAVTVNTAQTISFNATVGTLKISSATVNLGSATTLAPPTPTSIDLSGIGSEVSGRVNNGVFLLSITNPFAVSGALTATFTGGPQSVVKTLVLSPAATSTDTLMFTNADLQNLLGYSLSLGFSGTVSGAAITIMPGQTVAVSSRLQINLETVSK
ncbi:MAG TPA: hypothetical protein VMH39_10570 [Gemmatimonadaceae bacterium]|nr:hypothetical protein [Gemmatimonadaceae bacterium]